jgi:hypothetical protein
MHRNEFTKGKRGEFRGDFTRDTFDPQRHYSRVLMQQGRVQLDADWNEHVSIQLHYLRALGADLMGPHAAPRTIDNKPGEGFAIRANDSTFDITAGHYYVAGILCENDNDCSFDDQPDYPGNEQEFEANAKYLVYLDVWERHLSFVEDDYMRESALGGPDTASRAGIVWQVKVRNFEDFGEDTDPGTFKTDYIGFLKAIGKTKPGSGRLKARARMKSNDENDPCLISPEARYRGAENQLYRVEIHNNSRSEGGATYKWSRENGSVIFPITKISDRIITLEHMGRDGRFGLKPNDWVELVDDDLVLHGLVSALRQIESVDSEKMQVFLKETDAPAIGLSEDKHPYLRRWDQKGGGSNAVPVSEKGGDHGWDLLEDGVEVQFVASDEPNDPRVYETGDYWLIPARSITGDVEWPSSVTEPQIALPAQGVEHRYAPLGNISVNASGNITNANIEDLRRKLTKIWS